MSDGVLSQKKWTKCRILADLPIFLLDRGGGSVIFCVEAAGSAVGVVFFKG